MQRLFLLVPLFLIISSCAGPKYTLTYLEARELNFKNGKWLLNQTRSNSGVLDAQLYKAGQTGFEEILGDSLMTLSEVRAGLLVPKSLEFSDNPEFLKQIGRDSSCEFLINIRGTVIAENAGSFSVPLNDFNYYAINESKVGLLCRTPG